MNTMKWVKLIWGIVGAAIGAVGTFFGFSM